MYISLIHNISLLLGLIVVYDLLIRSLKFNQAINTIATGILFGVITLVGMLLPVEYSPGIFYDGRSIILSLAGLFTGPVSAFIAAFIAGAYRIYIGGAGMWAGIATIVASTYIGVAFRYKMQNRSEELSLFQIYVFGIIVHIIMLALQFLLIPNGSSIVSTIWLPILLFFPLTTLVIGGLLNRNILLLKTEEKLKESEEEYRSLFEEHRAVKLIIDPHSGKIIDANKAAAEYYGWPREKLKSMYIYELNTLPQNQINEAMQRAKKEQHVFFEFRHRHANGTIHDVEEFTSNIRFKGGEYLHSIIHDITERKATEEMLQRMEENFRRTLEELPFGIRITNNKGETLYTNKAFLDIYGYTSIEDFKNTPIEQRYKPESYAQHLERKARRQRGEDTPSKYDIDIVDVKKNIHTLRVIRKKILWNRELQNMIIYNDITQQKLFEKELQNNREYLQAVLDSINDAVFVDDADSGTIIDVNRGMCEMYGYTHGEAIALPISELSYGLPPYSQSEALEWLHKTRTEGPQRFEWLAKKKDGTLFWVEVSSRFVVIGGKNRFVVIVRDITKRKKMEEELLQSRELYEKFFNEDLAGIFLAKTDGTIITCNTAFKNIFGIKQEMKNSVYDLKSFFRSPEKFFRVLSMLEGRQKIEHIELHMIKRDGTKLNIVANVVGHFSNDGKLKEIQGYLYDETKRILLEEQLRESQKFEGLGTIASGIAHDFNNILGIILAHNSLIQQGVLSKEKLKQSTDAIERATQRGAALVRQMLTFAKKAETVLEPINLNALATEMLKMLEETFPKTIEISLELENDLPFIIADSVQMHQVILNLCVNARDAMPRGGKLIIRTKTLTEKQISERIPLPSAEQYIELSIHDTGIGISEHHKHRIFDPFFTTKEPGKGTGLGLSVVYAIITSLNGFIDVKSNVGVGSSFYIYLPAVKDVSPLTIQQIQEVETIKEGTETILIIEDEDALRELLAELLEIKGYKVYKAEDGYTGVELYKKYSQSIDVVISDIGLPKLSGEEVFETIHNHNPSVKVILASGFIDPHQKTQLLSRGVSDLIGKPYRPEEVLKKIREILDNKQ